MPYKLVAEYLVSTPMFVGDAFQSASRISPSTFKGALQFWWRALNWSRHRSQSDSDESALALLRAEEADLFGSTAESGGQSKVAIRRIALKHPQFLSKTDLDRHPEYGLSNSRWQGYMLGLGLMEYKKVHRENFYKRGALVSASFVVTVTARESEVLDSIRPSLELLGLLGGMGSRARRGLGSVCTESLTEESVNRGNTETRTFSIPANSKEFSERLRVLLAEWQDDNFPPLSAFSKHAKIYVSEPVKMSGWSQLAGVSRSMQMYRGWGNSYQGGPHKILGLLADHNSYSRKEKDHGLIYELAEKRRIDENQDSDYPSSFIWGLPRTYNLSNTLGSPIKVEPIRPARQTETHRRASPLFVHIHGFPSGETMQVQCLLPAVFLPSSYRLDFAEKRNQRTFSSKGSVKPKTREDWSVIEGYLQKQSEQWTEVKLI